MAALRLFFVLSLLITSLSALGQAVKPADLTGTYAAQWIIPKGEKLSAAAKKTKASIERDMKLVLEPTGRYVLKTGDVARVGTWHIAKGQLSLAPEARPGLQGSVVVYYISENKKMLTPKLSSHKEPFIRFVRSSKSVKL